MTTTIQLDVWDFLDRDTAEEQIVNRIADVAMGKLTGGHTESFHSMAVEAINRAINERLSAMIEEKLAKPIPNVDRFGEVKGEPKSLNDILAEAVDECLDEQVDMHGKPTRDSFSKKGTRLQWLIGHVAKSEIRTVTEKAARRVNDEAKAAVQKQVADAIAATLAKKV